MGATRKIQSGLLYCKGLYRNNFKVRWRCPSELFDSHRSIVWIIRGQNDQNEFEWFEKVIINKILNKSIQDFMSKIDQIRATIYFLRKVTQPQRVETQPIWILDTNIREYHKKFVISLFISSNSNTRQTFTWSGGRVLENWRRKVRKDFRREKVIPSSNSRTQPLWFLSLALWRADFPS